MKEEKQLVDVVLKAIKEDQDNINKLVKNKDYRHMAIVLNWDKLGNPIDWVEISVVRMKRDIFEEKDEQL